MKPVIIIAIAVVMLIPLPVFAESFKEKWDLLCDEHYEHSNKVMTNTKLNVTGDWLDICLAYIPLDYSLDITDCQILENTRKTLQVAYGGDHPDVMKEEVRLQLAESTKLIKEFCTEPEIELPIVRELTSQMRGQATIWCTNALENKQGIFNWNNCIDDQLKILQSQPEPELEPVITADDTYKMICSAPDGYCMERYGMNNPDSYGTCLEQWVPFCKTYEQKQEPQEPPHDAVLDGFTPSSEIVCGKGTIEKNGQCVVDTSKSSKGGGCLIATATYGSELAPQVQQLRELRDNSLSQSESGTNFMSTFNDVYYSFSPIIADYERENPLFKELVKLTITPMISSLSILNYVDMDSEYEVLGYGISLIILNGMMYVGVPLGIVIGIRKSF